MTLKWTGSIDLFGPTLLLVSNLEIIFWISWGVVGFIRNDLGLGLFEYLWNALLHARICPFYCFEIITSYARVCIFAHFNCRYSKNKICQHVDLDITRNMQKFPCQSEFMSLSYSENRNVFCSHSAQFCEFWPKIFSTPRFSHMADLINPSKKI